MFTWGKLGRVGNHVSLYAEFDRPVKVTFIINFNVHKYSVVVEQILNSGGFYITSGKRGDRIQHVIDSPRVLLEVPDTGFRPYWNKIYNKSLIKKLKKDEFTRKEAFSFIEERRSSIAELADIRIP